MSGELAALDRLVHSNLLNRIFSLHLMSSLPRITRLKSHQVNYEYFREHHLVSNSPCIFPPSLAQHWSLFNKWFTPDAELDYDYLKAQYGSLEVNCIDCEEPNRDEIEPSTFGQLLDLWQARKGQTKYLKDWHLPLEIQRSEGSTRKGKEKLRQELYKVETVCLDDWINELEGNESQGKGDDFRFVVRKLFQIRSTRVFGELKIDLGKISTREVKTLLLLYIVMSVCDSHLPIQARLELFTDGSYLPDCSYSISTQIRGRKLWYLFPPSCTPFLLPLITTANRQGRGINCHEWTEENKSEFESKGMIKVWQEVKETIFM
jgi:hypothetical protein